MRAITAIAVLVLVGPALAQGERPGPGPDARRGAGIEQKLEQILHRLEMLEQRVEQRDADRAGPQAGRRDRDRGDRDQRGPDRRRGDSRRGPDFRGPDSRGPDARGPDRRGGPQGGPMAGGPQRGGPGGDAAAPMAQFRRLMQAAQQGDVRARTMLGHMRDAINKMLGDQPKPDAKAKAKKQQRAKATKTTKATDARADGATSRVQLGLLTQPPTFTIVTDANIRRVAALKLLSENENNERAARVLELRMKAQGLQAEIEALRAQLAK